MRIKDITRLSCLCALSGSLMVPSGAWAGQTPVELPALSGESQDIQKAKGDPSPGAADSQIDNYLNQDEQLNLDANAGNVRVLRTNQKALVNDFVTKTYEVKNVNSRELRNVLRTILGLEGGRAEVIKDKGSNQQFVQVICPKFMLPYLDKAIPALDESWVREYDTGSGDVYYKALNRNAAAIDFIASNYASDSGFSAVDATNNAVSRIDEPYRVEHYLEAAKTVDIPANQALIDVAIYEVNSNNDLKLGLDYINWKNGPGRNLAEFIYQGAVARTEASNLTSVFDPFRVAGDPAGDSKDHRLRDRYYQSYRAVNYLLTSNYIDFLQVKGEARVMTKKSLMVKSSNTATLAAEDVIVALVSSPGDIDAVGPDTRQGVASKIESNEDDGIIIARNDRHGEVLEVPVNDSDRKLNNRPAGAAGVFLSVTPFVGLESMELVINISNADLNGLAPNGEPIINTRDVSTTVRLRDGEQYVISGLKRTHDVKDTNKAPGLGDIPVLGYLFGGENEVKRSNDVVIVVTPHFYLSSQPKIMEPASVKDLTEVVGGKAAQLPSNPYGYDQWLLDK